MIKFYLQVVVFFIFINTSFAQSSIPVLHDSLQTTTMYSFQPPVDRLILTNFSEWKFYPADDTLFAKPDFDDSDWYDLRPTSSNLISVTDSLWQGYGWWRFTFRADSTFYDSARLLRYNSNGAAEIYLDGKLVSSFGNPSGSKQNEILPSVSQSILPVINLQPKEYHVLAVRFSFQNYDRYNKLSYSKSLRHGFMLQLVDPVYNEQSHRSTLVRSIPLAFSMILLFMIMMRHLFFYIRFPNENANLWIFLLTAHLFIIVSLLLYTALVDLPVLQSIINPYLYSFLGYQLLCLIPYSLSSILKTNTNKAWFYLIWLGIPLSIIHYVLNSISPEIAEFIPFVLSVLILCACYFIIRKAYELKRRSLWLLSTGILSTPLLMIVTLILLIIFGFDIPHHRAFDYAFFIFIIFAFNSLPVCMSVYMDKTFFELFSDLESNVAERTRELNTKNQELITANTEIQKQRDELIIARDNLQKALDDLKAAQEQLIQQEKLSSLGQLTAGIAHEIKNPLNFVTNFSDVSLEMIEEVREEVKRQKTKGKSDSERSGEPRSEKEKSPFEGGAEVPDGTEVGDDGARIPDQPQNIESDSNSANTPLNPLSRGEAGSSPDKALILEILDDIEANLRKIHEHGTRADGIVKSMLQHSRGGDGKMEPTDLNGLVKEYVNLSFHGMRASKNPINVDIELDLDESIGEVPLVGEDFSRVILNLCNNAFDAMREKTLQGFETLGGLEGYQPKLTVRTKSDNGKVVIEIEDNGPGIPEEMKDKILQPFFTTKKGTEGTGLGLSITNDIVKAHGAELKVETKKGESTKFIVHFNPN